MEFTELVKAEVDMAVFSKKKLEEDSYKEAVQQKENKYKIEMDLLRRLRQELAPVISSKTETWNIGIVLPDPIYPIAYYEVNWKQNPPVRTFIGLQVKKGWFGTYVRILDGMYPTFLQKFISFMDSIAGFERKPYVFATIDTNSKDLVDTVKREMARLIASKIVDEK